MEDGTERFVKAYRWSNASLQLKLPKCNGKARAETSICGTIEGLEDELQLIHAGALCEKTWDSDPLPKWLISRIANLFITK